MKQLSWLLLGLVLTGCSGYINPGKNPDPVQISGTVTSNGKNLSDLVLNFQPTGSGVQAVFPVKDGKYSGTVTPGTYTYYLSEGRSAAAFKAVPQSWRAGSMDRQQAIEGGTFDVKVQ
ncbi:hypothetical protein BH10PLA2_BH10PLA2_32810 [soil metagenome]